MEQNAQKQSHGIRLDKRSHMDISGVLEVESFDDVSVILKTDCGELTVEGMGIRIGTLDTDRGVVELDGKVDAVYYSEERENKRSGFFTRRAK